MERQISPEIELSQSNEGVQLHARLLQCCQLLPHVLHMYEQVFIKVDYTSP